MKRVIATLVSVALMSALLFAGTAVASHDVAVVDQDQNLDQSNDLDVSATQDLDASGGDGGDGVIDQDASVSGFGIAANSNTGNATGGDGGDGGTIDASISVDADMSNDNAQTATVNVS